MNIFTLPFSRAVWLASVALIAVISFLLYSAFRWEYREKGAMNWTDVVLLSLGAVCQQGDCLRVMHCSKCLTWYAAFLNGSLYFITGSTLEAQGITGRTVTIMLYIVVIFLYTSYSACIVALLQSTTDSIQTLEDLYHSGLTLGAVDVVYSRHFFSVSKLCCFCISCIPYKTSKLILDLVIDTMVGYDLSGHIFMQWFT